MRSPVSEQPRDRGRGGWGRRVGPWLPAAVGVVCYLNTLGNDLTYDDRPLILHNPRIHSLADFRAVWLTDWWRLLEDSDEYDAIAWQRDRLYRPLTLYTFAVNYAFGGTAPWGYHLVNVLLHAAACALVWAVGRRLLEDDAAAAVAAVLFAVHPVHAEAVAGIVGRAEVLATVCLLGGLWLLAPPRGQPGLGRTAAAALVFLAALFAKETAVCYPALAVFVLWWRRAGSVATADVAPPVPQTGTRRRSRRGSAAVVPLPGRTEPTWGRWLVRVVVLLLPLAVYFPLRYVALEGALFRARPADVLMNPLVTATLEQRVLGAFTVLGHYTRLLIVPSRLCSDYGLAIVNPEQIFTNVTAVGLVAAAALWVGLLGFVRHGAGWRQVAWLTAMLAASYALISNTVLLIGVSLAERLMYWPSVLFCLLVGLGAARLRRRLVDPLRPLVHNVRLIYGLGLGVLIALGLRTGVRNMDWANNITLFTCDVRTRPEGAFLRRNCALEIMNIWRGEPTSSAPLTELARVVEDHLATLGLWRADWPAEQKRAALLRAAEEHLTQAIRIHPAYSDALVLRGRVRAELGDRAGAERDLTTAVLLAPNDQEARGVLNRLTQGADAAQRLAELEVAVTTRPGDIAAELELVQALLEAGRFEDAESRAASLAAGAPDNVDAQRLYGNVLALKGDGAAAIAALRRVVALAPEDWAAHANLTTLLEEEGDAAAALAHAQRAHALQPADLRVQVNLAGALARAERFADALDLYRHIERNLLPDHPLRAVVARRIAELESRADRP